MVSVRAAEAGDSLLLGTIWPILIDIRVEKSTLCRGPEAPMAQASSQNIQPVFSVIVSLDLVILKQKFRTKQQTTEVILSQGQRRARRQGQSQ